MIIVDVYVPALDREYNFNLDQNVRVSTIIEEISEMIAHKEHSQIMGNMDELRLCDRSGEKILSAKATLSSSGIRTGSKLILV